MAGGKIVGITLSIEGQTSGLTKSLKEANSSVSKTTSAIKDLDKALKLDPSSVELLTQKQSLLTDAISGTEKELDILKQVAEDAAKGLEDGTVTKEQYAQLSAEIVKTEHSLSELQNEASATADAMENVADPETVDEIDKMGNESEETGEQMKESSTKIDLFGSALDALSNPMAIASAGIAAVVEIAKTGIEVFQSVAGAVLDVAEAVGTTLYDATKSGVEALGDLEQRLIGYSKEGASYADTVITEATKMGITTEKFQELQYAAELADTSLETISGSMTKNLKSMNTASKATEDKMNDAAEAYKLLGVEIFDTDGQLRDSETVFWEVIDALGQMDDQTTKELTAMTLLGKSAKELNPLIATGSDNMSKFAAEARDMGYVLSDDVLERYGALDDQIQRLDNGLISLKNGFGLIFLPLLTDLATDGVSLLSQFSKGVANAGGDVEKIGAVIQDVLPKAISSILKNLPKWIEITNSLIQTILQSVIDNLPAILDGIFSVIETIADTLLAPENIEKIMASITTIIGQLTDFVIEHGPELIDIGVQIIVSIINGLSQAIPQLAPKMAEAIKTIVEALTKPETLTALINSAVVLILALAQGLADAMPQLTEAIPPLVEAICTAIEVLAPLITEVGLQLFESLLNSGTIQDTMTTLAPLILDLIMDIGGALVEFGSQLPGMMAQVFLDLGADAFDWGVDLIAQLIDGIKSMFSSLWDVCKDAASGIADFLGFSVPKKGPLAEWGVHNPGSDMVDLFTEGIEKELPTLQASVDLMANTLSQSSGPDYSAQLSEMNRGINAIGNQEIQVVAPVYIGDERIETTVVNATRNANYLSGGR